jgi:protease I
MGAVARVGVLVRDGYQELEFWYPLLRLREEGADVTVIGAGDRTYHSRLGYPVIPDVTLASASDQLDAIVVPGASARDAVDADTRQFLKQAHARGAIVAATSEGPRALAEAGILQGQKASSEGVSVDGSVITARSADDLPAFFRALDAALQRKVQ